MTPDLFAYIGLGSNLGDRAGNLPVAVRDQPSFLNMVAELRVEIFSAEQTLARLLRIEYALGRRRERSRGPRTIDLDLLLYADEQRTTQLLTLPHPRLH